MNTTVLRRLLVVSLAKGEAIRMVAKLGYDVAYGTPCPVDVLEAELLDPSDDETDLFIETYCSTFERDTM